MRDAENAPAQFTTSLHDAVDHVKTACVLTGGAYVECSTADVAVELTKALMSIGIADMVDPANITISVPSTGVTKTLDTVLLELVVSVAPELARLLAILSQPEGHD